MEETKKESDPVLEDQIYEQFYNLKSVASACELTGLTPALPVSEDSAESYAQLYGGMPVPDHVDGKKYVKNEKEPKKGDKSARH